MKASRSDWLPVAVAEEDVCAPVTDTVVAAMAAAEAAAIKKRDRTVRSGVTRVRQRTRPGRLPALIPGSDKADAALDEIPVGGV